MSDPRRRIPSVEALLASAPFSPLLEEAGRARVIAALRAEQEALRAGLADVSSDEGGVAAARLEDPAWHAGRVRSRLERETARSLRPVINATGVVLHTNLGRAALPSAARRAMQEAAGYAALEYDLIDGSRGSRYDHCSDLLCALTGGEAALVVNNNAAAVVLALNTLGEGRQALISRGELVEIGGSFRVPEIMGRSGVRMREVGATNRTHLRDYEEALTGDVALVLKVHRSNFRLEGFTADVEIPELAALAASRGLPLVHDLGSGALLDMSRLGLPPEPTARQALEAGADVVTMSGDKLLGGPQAGIIVGKASLVERMRTNPLCRALRCDKVTLAGLEATLALYRDGRAEAEVPVLRMLGTGETALRQRADSIAGKLRGRGIAAERVAAPSAVGGGAYPGVELPGSAVAVRTDGGAESLGRRLRLGSPPVVGYIRDDRLLLHLRTVEPGEEETLIDAVVAAEEGHPAAGEEVGDA